MSSKNRSLLAIGALALAMSLCQMTRANLVTNSDFSAFVSAPKNFFSIVQPTDWATTAYAFIDAPNTADDLYAPGVPVWGPFPNPPLGGNFLQSDGSSGLAAPVTQTINSLVVGQTYNLSFYQAGGQQVNDYGATSDYWQVSLGSQTQNSALMSVPSAGVFPWQAQTMPFTATSTSEVLSFLAVGSGGLPPMVFLANPDLESTVPEPSAPLLLVGVGSVAAIGRFGRRALAKSPAV
jgi:hypothetical protein